MPEATPSNQGNTCNIKGGMAKQKKTKTGERNLKSGIGWKEKQTQAKISTEYIQQEPVEADMRKESRI